MVRIGYRIPDPKPETPTPRH